jgi:hypothetical protein
LPLLEGPEIPTTMASSPIGLLIFSWLLRNWRIEQARMRGAGMRL